MQIVNLVNFGQLDQSSISSKQLVLLGINQDRQETKGVRTGETSRAAKSCRLQVERVFPNGDQADCSTALPQTS